MNFQAWKIFRDIAKTKSFVKAAKLNYVTQPSASIQLKQLEEEMGVKLVNRVPRRVSLTDEGERLLPHIEDLIERSEQLKVIAGEHSTQIKGDVRIATIHSIGLYELSTPLKNCIRKYPQLRIHLQYRRADTIYDLVQENSIDLGIVAYPENRSRIKVIPFGSDQMVLIAPPHHPLAKKKSVQLMEIEGEDFIAFEKGIPTREALDELFESKNIHVTNRMINENIDTLKKAVEVGLGISIVPRKTVEEECRKGVLNAITLAGADLKRPLGIITLKGRSLSHPVQVFLDLLTGKIKNK